MGYSDQKFYSRPQIDYGVFDLGTATASGTASNSLTQTAANMLPSYTRRTQINNVQVECIVAPNASATALVLSFLNGTNTFAAVTLTTATASQILSATMTAANAIFAVNGQATEGLIGTFTASGGTAGKYRIQFEEQELPA